MTELKSKILYTIVILLLCRLGTYIPLTGIDRVKVKYLIKEQEQGLLGLYNVFSGGALGRISIFALGVMPYISASIIMQVLSSIIPYLRYLKSQGEYGRKIISGGTFINIDNKLIPNLNYYIKNKSYKWMFYIILISLLLNIALNTNKLNKKEKKGNNTNILSWITTLIESIFIIMYYVILNPSITAGVTFILATLQSIYLIFGLKENFYKKNEIPNKSFTIQNTVKLIFGTSALVYFGELITQNGIGNGISLIIFSGIIAGIPRAILQTLELGRIGAISTPLIIGLLLLVFALIGGVVFVETAQRKIPIQYLKRQVGDILYGGQTTYLPLRINMAGVIPPIFASSLLLFPISIAAFSSNFKLTEIVSKFLGRGTPSYMIIYFVLIFIFAYFYTNIIFDPSEMASNLKKYGGFIPGILPGKDTAKYLSLVINRLTFFGGTYLGLICLLPEFLTSKFSVPFYLGGTSILITVVVALDTIRQIQSYLMAIQYEKLIKKASLISGSTSNATSGLISGSTSNVASGLISGSTSGTPQMSGFGLNALTYFSKNSPKEIVIDALSELKKVTWLSREQLSYNTRMVLLFIVISIIFIFLIDSFNENVLNIIYNYGNDNDDDNDNDLIE